MWLLAALPGPCPDPVPPWPVAGPPAVCALRFGSAERVPRRQSSERCHWAGPRSALDVGFLLGFLRVPSPAPWKGVVFLVARWRFGSPCPLLCRPPGGSRARGCCADRSAPGLPGDTAAGHGFGRLSVLRSQRGSLLHGSPKRSSYLLKSLPWASCPGAFYREAPKNFSNVLIQRVSPFGRVGVFLHVFLIMMQAGVMLCKDRTCWLGLWVGAHR